jgi:hypothetical protein
MIREAVETLGPPGVLPSGEAVISLHGPEPIHEAQAMVDALPPNSTRAEFPNPSVISVLLPVWKAPPSMNAAWPFSLLNTKTRLPAPCHSPCSLRGP